ncbi:hypothetical protein [Ureibacillus manganicus]|nr:hypothetical protein [Ureibacillus manganicus]
MRMPALPQSKELETEKKVKGSFLKTIRKFFSNKIGKKQKSFRLPPRE